MASVELRRVSKVFSGSTPVLDEIDLQVEDGELLVLVGPNGCGKTTLLRVLAGLERVTAGEVWLAGRNVTYWPARHRDIAMVFQSGVLYPHLTVEQNLRMGLRRGARGAGGGIGWFGSRRTNRPGADRAGQRSDGRDRQVPEDRVRDMAQQLGIESLLGCLPRQLSGGERQRVALGRALVRQPAVFLLDEPAAYVDVTLRRQLHKLFQQVRQKLSGTMILVSHDHEEALASGQRIAVLGRGKIQQIGPAQQVYASPVNRYVAECLGRTAVNFVDGCWSQENGECHFVNDFGSVAVPSAIAGRLVPKGAAGGTGRMTLGWRWTGAVARPVSPSAAASSTSRSSTAGWSGVVEWLEMDEGGTRVFVTLGKDRMGGSGGESATVSARIASSQIDSSQFGSGRNGLDRIDVTEQFRPGERVEIQVDWQQALWFDCQTGVNLQSRDGGVV